MKKALIGILMVLLIGGGLIFWQGENILYMIFYDMDATMDLPENLYDHESLNDSEISSDICIAEV